MQQSNGAPAVVPLLLATAAKLRHSLSAAQPLATAAGPGLAEGGGFSNRGAPAPQNWQEKEADVSYTEAGHEIRRGSQKQEKNPQKKNWMR